MDLFYFFSGVQFIFIYIYIYIYIKVDSRGGIGVIWITNMKYHKDILILLLGYYLNFDFCFIFCCSFIFFCFLFHHLINININIFTKKKKTLTLLLFLLLFVGCRIICKKAQWAKSPWQWNKEGEAWVQLKIVMRGANWVTGKDEVETLFGLLSLAQLWSLFQIVTWLRNIMTSTYDRWYEQNVGELVDI